MLIDGNKSPLIIKNIPTASNTSGVEEGLMVLLFDTKGNTYNKLLAEIGGGGGGSQDLQSILGSGNVAINQSITIKEAIDSTGFSSMDYQYFQVLSETASNLQMGGIDDELGILYTKGGSTSGVYLDFEGRVAGGIANFSFPSNKVAGDYILATTADITGGTTITGTPNILTKINGDGDNVEDSSISDTGNKVTIENPVEIDSGVAETSGLNFTNLRPTVAASNIVYGTGGNYPWRMIVDNTGTLYAADRTDGTVRKTPIGGPTTVLATPGGYTSDLVMNVAGDIFTVNRTTATVSKITPSGTLTTFATLSGTLVSIVMNSAEDLFVIGVTVSSFTIYKITSAGVVTTFGTQAGLTGVGVTEFLINKNTQDMYVLWHKSVYKVTPAGTITLLATVSALGAQGGLMCIDPFGTLYLANFFFTGTTIQKVTAAGVVSVLATTPSAGRAIESDTLGNVYLTGPSNTITKTTPLGVTTTLGTVGDTPNSIAIDKNNVIYTANEISKDYNRIVQPYTKEILTIDINGNVVINPNIFTDVNGVGYLPNVTPNLITGDITGKAILTKEYFNSMIGTVAPASATDIGTPREIRVTSTFIYTCVATNTWVRAAVATW